MSENGEKALIHEALRDLRQEVRSVSSEVAELRVEVSALGVESLNDRMSRCEDRNEGMRDQLACLVQSQSSLKRQVEKYLPYALMLAFGGAQATNMFDAQLPPLPPIPPAAASE